MTTSQLLVAQLDYYQPWRKTNTKTNKKQVPLPPRNIHTSPYMKENSLTGGGFPSYPPSIAATLSNKSSQALTRTWHTIYSYCLRIYQTALKVGVVCLYLTFAI